MKEPAISKPSSDRGFSLIELLVVVAIIAIMAAISLPSIARYLRVYKIRGASQEVAKEIQSVRGKAISKNVNFGMVFLVVDNVSYRWVAEDDMNSSDATFVANARVPLASALPNPTDPPAGPQSGPLQFLPQGIEFSQLCTETAGGAWESGMRFSRLGSWCRPTATEPCPPIDQGTDFVWTDPSGAGAMICLRQADTGLTRTIAVATGGRVQTQQ
ncbi:MAG: prepilin-type N-terminal cleavage/methylation domain-containing protein [Vicinamibacteria bacterium]